MLSVSSFYLLFHYFFSSLFYLSIFCLLFLPLYLLQSYSLHNITFDLWVCLFWQFENTHHHCWSCDNSAMTQQVTQPPGSANHWKVFKICISNTILTPVVSNITSAHVSKATKSAILCYLLDPAGCLTCHLPVIPHPCARLPLPHHLILYLVSWWRILSILSCSPSEHTLRNIHNSKQFCT